MIRSFLESILARTMHDLDDESVRKLFGEAIIDELKAIREYLNMIPDASKRLLTLEDHVEVVGGKVRVISAVSRAQEQDIRTLKQNMAHVRSTASQLSQSITS